MIQSILSIFKERKVVFMRKLSIFVAVLILVLSVSVVLGQATTTTYPQPSEYGPGILNWGPNVKYGGTLKAYMQWGKLTDSLNPFASFGSSLPIVFSGIYEPLFYVNPLNGQTTYMLATSYQWKDNNTELVVKIRKDVKWSDGTPFTPQDVVFTFNLLKQYPALDTAGLWMSNAPTYLTDCYATGDSVIFKLSSPNVNFASGIGGTVILPEHIWSKVKDPQTWTNLNPIGTGPLLFKSFNPSLNMVTAVRNPNYWMKGRPYINELQITSVDTVEAEMLAMLKHQADFSYGVVSDVQDTWVTKDPSVNKIWWPVWGTQILFLNTQKYPFSIPTFRIAIDLAIDKSSIEQKSYFNMGGVANVLGILPNEVKEWIDPTLVASVDYLSGYHPKEAAALLSSIGFKRNSAGVLCDPQGNPLPSFTLVVPNEMPDYITDALIIAQNLKENLGMNINISQTAFGPYVDDLMKGSFDMSIAVNSFGGIQYRYQTFLPFYSASKIGQTASADWSRYTNPLITAAIGVYNSTTDLRLQKQAIYTIERIFLMDMPQINFVNAVRNEEYSELNFVGWPSDSYPYSDGADFSDFGGELMVLNVHLK